VNTAADPPNDIYPDLDGPPFPEEGYMHLSPRSFVCYVAKDLS